MSRRRALPNLLLLLLASLPGAIGGAELPDAWQAFEDRHDEIEAYARDYQRFLGRSQTESRAVAAAEELARRARFRPVAWDEAPPTDGPFYTSNRGRALVLVRPGRRPLTDGLRVVAAHIDTPRLELKARPLYEKQGFALWQTVPHGGIKYYQWANVPLALVGRVYKTDGSRVDVSVGLSDGDPVFLIPDLAPHVDRPRRGRTSREVLKGEELDPLVGSRPNGEGSRKDRILEILDEELGITAQDLVSAELNLVPAQSPREVGLDRGLIMGYGQDDKSCGFAALQALLDTRRPEYWSVVYLADNEESGSNNNTGARSQFFQTLVASWLAAAGQDSQLALRHTLGRSVVASADVTTGVNPLDPGVQEQGNASRLNGGVVLKRYGRGNDPNAEVLARIRRILDDHGLPWQTHTYKVDVGGGGTLGGFLSVWDMEVFDVGVPLLSLHSPLEVASKADLYAFHRFLRAFFEDGAPPTE